PCRLRVRNAAVSDARYLGKSLRPTKLTSAHQDPRWSIQLWQVVLGSALLALITVLAVRERRRRPFLAVGWLYFLGTLVPVIGLVQVGSQAMADRYAYIPMMGIVIVAVWLVVELVSSWRLERRVLIAATSCLALILAALTGR